MPWDSSREAVSVLGHRYEPWILANRKAIPWHDVRFRGYGQNKIVHGEGFAAILAEHY